MKAVVLARGRGTRMQRDEAGVALAAAQSAMADAGLKAMIPFRRPFLDYVLSALADADCTDVCLVVGPEHAVVRDYYAHKHRPERVRVSFAVQPQPLGTADAVLAAETFAGTDPFLTLNADNYYPAEVFRALVALDGPGLPAFDPAGLVRGSNIEPDRVRAYAILRINEKGDLQDIVEKPDARLIAEAGDRYFVSMNCWRFGPSIFTACRRIGRSPRGEYELPSAVRYAITEMGERFRAVAIDCPVLDLSRRTDVAAVERRLDSIDPRP
jgi:dTDP-glucose pyrophosphorylase